MMCGRFTLWQKVIAREKSRVNGEDHMQSLELIFYEDKRKINNSDVIVDRIK